MIRRRFLFIFSRLHSDPHHIHYKCGSGITQQQILHALHELDLDVCFGGQEDPSYPEDYVRHSAAILFIAPALRKLLPHKPSGKLILYANNSHVLTRNERMRASAKTWRLPVESTAPEPMFLDSYRHADHIIVAANQRCIETFTARGIPTEKIFPFHNGIDTDFYKPGPEKFREFTFLYWASEVGLRKGLPALLAAWKKWNNPRAKLIIMGMVTKVGRKLLYRRDWLGRLSPRVPPNIELHVTPYDSQVGRPSGDPFFREMMAKSHVGVFPTLEDNQPACVMEMAASGLPIITTVESGFNLDPSWSYRITADEVSSLVAAFEVAYRDPELAHKSARARQFMIDHHGWDDYRERLKRFITDIIA